MLGQPFIILNSAKIAADMLDKKSSIYSDRPTLQMAGELVGWKNALILLPYGDRFRRYRRFFHSVIGSNALMRPYRPMQEMQTRQFLRKVLKDPEQLQEHLRQYVLIILIIPIYLDEQYNIQHRWIYYSSDLTRIRSPGK